MLLSAFPTGEPILKYMTKSGGSSLSFRLPVNLKSEQVWASRREHGWEPVHPDACPTVADIPGLMEEKSPFEGIRRRSGLSVFIQYWNNTTDEGRQRMAAAEMPDRALPPEELAAAAAIVHGLCVKDDIETPQWALEAKTEQPICLFTGAENPENVSRLTVGSAGVCAQHNVFYPEEFLEKV